jgi:hypothetical protein
VLPRARERQSRTAFERGQDFAYDTGKRAEIVGKTDSLVNLCEYIEIFRISSLVFAFLSINLQNNNTISQRDKMNNLTKD